MKEKTKSFNIEVEGETLLGLKQNRKLYKRT